MRSDWPEKIGQLNTLLTDLTNDPPRENDLDYTLGVMYRTYQDLCESESRYEMFITNSSDGIYRFDADGPVDTSLPVDIQIEALLRCMFLGNCNKAFARMFGAESPEKLVGLRLYKMLPDIPETRDHLADYIRSQYRLENSVTHEVDGHGNPLVYINSVIGRVVNGLHIRAWGSQCPDINYQKPNPAACPPQSIDELLSRLNALTNDVRLPHELQKEMNSFSQEIANIIPRLEDLEDIVSHVRPAD